MGISFFLLTRAGEEVGTARGHGGAAGLAGLAGGHGGRGSWPWGHGGAVGLAGLAGVRARGHGGAAGLSGRARCHGERLLPWGARSASSGRPSRERARSAAGEMTWTGRGHSRRRGPGRGGAMGHGRSSCAVVEQALVASVWREACARDRDVGRNAGYFARYGLEAVFFSSIDVFQPGEEPSACSTLSLAFSPLHLGSILRGQLFRRLTRTYYTCSKHIVSW